MNPTRPEDFNEILTQFAATERRLITELNSLDLNFAPSTEGWSGGQVLAHLIKTERYFHPLFFTAPMLGALPVVLTIVDKLNVALCKLAGLKFIANGESQPKGLASLNPSFKGRFVAPRFLRPGKKLYERETLLKQRTQARQRTLKLMRRIGGTRLRALRFSHPELGPLTLWEMLLFISKHEAWHTEQLKRLKERMKNESSL